MNNLCTDNRFELIEKYKKKMIEATNIETSTEEMKVLDNILFRFWQMGWLEKMEQPEIIRCKDCRHSSPNGKYGCKSYHYRLYETYEMKPDDFCSYAERRTDDV